MKISKSDMGKIKKRLQTGETFTGIANEYGVKPWTIQKRFGDYHPEIKTQKNFKIWELVPEYQKICRIMAYKFKNYDNGHLIDFCLDSTLNLNKKTQNFIKNSPDRSRAFAHVIKQKIFYFNSSVKKDYILYIDYNTGWTNY